MTRPFAGGSPHKTAISLPVEAPITAGGSPHARRWKPPSEPGEAHIRNFSSIGRKASRGAGFRAIPGLPGNPYLNGYGTPIPFELHPSGSLLPADSQREIAAELRAQSTSSSTHTSARR
jgi:hypothetical protein